MDGQILKEGTEYLLGSQFLTHHEKTRQIHRGHAKSRAKAAHTVSPATRRALPLSHAASSFQPAPQGRKLRPQPLRWFLGAFQRLFLFVCFLFFSICAWVFKHEFASVIT